MGLSGSEIAAFLALFLVWIGSEVWIQWHYRLPAHAANRDRGSMAVLVASVWIAVVSGITLAALIPAAEIRAGRQVLFVIGLLLLVAGLLLRWYSIAILGPGFTVTVGTRAEQSLIERGPYRVVRHPSYSGSLLTILGVLFCFGNWLSILAIVLPLAGYGYRIQVEERALVEAFGDRYGAYRKRTRALIPYLF